MDAESAREQQMARCSQRSEFGEVPTSISEVERSRDEVGGGRGEAVQRRYRFGRAASDGLCAWDSRILRIEPMR